MGLLILSFAAAVLLVLVGMVGCGKQTAKGDSGSKVKHTTGKAQPVAPGSREDVLSKLRKLAKSDPPKDLNSGGLCYDMALPPPRREYVCPICNEKTLYADTKPGLEGTEFLAWDLEWCRRMVKQIKKINVTLDESAFCKKCKPDAKKQAMVLIVTYEDSKTTHRVSPVEPGDLTLLATFSQGKLKYGDQMSGETPLKKHIPRLEALLGVKLSTLKTKE